MDLNAIQIKLNEKGDAGYKFEKSIAFKII